MKKIPLLIVLLIIISLACDLSVTVSPATSPTPLPTDPTIQAAQDANLFSVIETNVPFTATAIPLTAVPYENNTPAPASATPILATAIPTALPTSLPPSSGEVEVIAGPLSMFLSSALANGVRSNQISPTEGQNSAYWDMTPGHTIIDLDGYPLQGKTNQPQIYIYPAQAYAEMVPGAFESIRRINNIIYNPGSQISSDQLPTVPFFNAEQVFTSNIQIIPFQNGSGVRFLTEYAQYPASANNQDLFYNFQGVTSDGAYYIVVILPVRCSYLAETSDGGAALPAGGIPYPYFADPNADMVGYYQSVSDLLNSAPPQAFDPAIAQLDSLVQSMRIIP